VVNNISAGNTRESLRTLSYREGCILRTIMGNCTENLVVGIYFLVFDRKVQQWKGIYPKRTQVQMLRLIVPFPMRLCSFVECGRRFDVGGSRIAQIVAKAVKKLQHKDRRKILKKSQ